MNKRIILMLPLILAAALFAFSSSIPSGHAVTGLVCITASTTATSCPAGAPSITPPAVGSTFSVGVFIQGSDAMGGFDIYVRSDPAFLTLTSAALGPLIVTPSLTSICINGTPQAGTCTVNTANGLGVVEVTTIEGSGGNECGGLAPCSGMAFTITYTVAATPSGSPLSYPTSPGCSASSVASPLNTCVEVADNVGTILSENIQGATVGQAQAAFDYTLSNNGPVSITQGSSGTVTVTATLKAGTSQAVTLSCVTPLPAGVGCSFAAGSNPVTPTGSSVLTISTSASTPTGPFSLMVTGSPLGATTTPTSVSVTVTAVPFDYSLSNNGPVSITAGSSGTVTITAKLTAGTAQPVTLSCSGLPVGITCGSFTVNPVSPTLAGATSVLTVNVAASVAAGSHTFQVTGSPLGATTTPTSLSVTVTSVPFDYSLSNNGPVTIQQGSSVPVTITATLKAGTAVPVTLSCVTPLPAGVGCNFGSNPVTPTGSSVLAISTSASTPLGPLTVMVTGSPLGATTTPTSVSVTVTAVPFDYSLSNNGPVSITAGSSGTVTVTATLTAGTAQPVTLSCSGLPAGITCGAFTVNPVTPTLAGATSVLTVNVAASVTTGSHSFMVTGSPVGATLSGATTTISVTVTSVPFDYSLSNNGPVTVQQGSSGTVTITATLKAGIAQPVTLSCVTPLPIGVSCSFAAGSNPVTPTGSSVLTISTSASAPTGGFTLMVTGAPLGATTTATGISVTVTAVPFDYSLSNNGPVSITAGGSGTVTITATLKAGTAQLVTLSCTGLPAGITCGSFTVNPVTPTLTGAASGLTINVASSVGIGSHSFQVTGSPVGATASGATTTVSVTVVPFVFDYSLSNNGPVSITAGSSGTVTISATLKSGTAQPVTLTCSGLPSGITCGSFTVNPVTPTLAGATSVLTVNVAASVAAGPHTFQVTGSPLGATTTPTTVSVTVTAVPPPFDYSLSNNGPVTVQQGSSGAVTITATLKAGIAQPVTLSCVTPLPIGVSCSFAAGSNPVTPTGSSVLTISTSASTPLGPLTVMVTGSPLGATTTPTSVGVTVTAIPPPFDYSLSNNGPISITVGSSGTVTVTATLKAGIAQPVTLSCVTPLASGITCTSFSVNPVTPTGSSMLTINGVVAGSFSVMVTGSPLGATTAPTTVSVTVTSVPFDYSLSNNGPVTVQQGSSGTVTITATLKGGEASQPVTLSCVTPLPSGITCTSFSMNPVTPTGSSILTINVASTVAPGPYSFMVSGSPLGATTTPTTVSVTVTSSSATPVLLTFKGFNLDDFDNGVGMFQVLVNGHLVVDIPAGLNHLSGTGDYAPYTNEWVNYGPFDITSFVIQGQNTIVFRDPTSDHFGLVRNVTIVQGTTTLLHVPGAKAVFPGHSVTYTFSIPPLVLASFTVSPATPDVDQSVTLTAAYTGGTAPFKCIFSFGDGERAVVTGVSGACSVVHDYDDSGTFHASVVVIGASTSDRVTGHLSITVKDDPSTPVSMLAALTIDDE